MLKRFLRVCSMILVVVMLANMLPAQALGTQLREALQADTSITLQDTVQSKPSSPKEITVLGEITEKRSEYIKEYLLSDGSRIAAVYADAVHYQKDGQWAEIDNTLKAVGIGTAGNYINTAGPWQVSFPQQLSGTKQITITKDGYTLSFGMAGRLNQSSGAVVASAGETVSITATGGSAETFAVAGAQTTLAQLQQVDLSTAKAAAKYQETVQDKLYSRLSYANVYANTNIVYDLQSDKVKESVILSQYDSTLRGYRYTLNTGGMIPVLAQDGHIDFYDANRQNIVMTMPAPFLVDAANAFCDDIQVTLTGSGSTYTLTYLLPLQWLSDSARAWPVILDPVVSAGIGGTNIADQTICYYDYREPTWAMLECGYDVNYGAERFFVAFNALPTLTSADMIVDATVSLYKPVTTSDPLYVSVHRVEDEWEPDTVSFEGGYNCCEEAEDFNMVSTPGWYNWDVTSLAQRWYRTDSNTGMMFRTTDAVEEAAVNRWAQFYSSDYGSYSPSLTIEYRNTNGLEDYWDYISSSAGRAGTGYVHAASGNLVWVRDLLGIDGNRMPVSISAIYNAGDRANNSFGMGYGWRTNYHQRVYASVGGYIWEDGDGTKHLFFDEDEDGIYYDEDGLDLTLTFYSDGTKRISDRVGNTSYFDSSGRLTKIENNQQTRSSITITYSSGNLINTITDGVGRVYSFNCPNGLVTKISYLGTGSTELAYVSLGYSNNTLQTITDADSKVCTYTYRNNTLLETAKGTGDTQLKFTYPYTPFNAYCPVEGITEYCGEERGTRKNLTYGNKSTVVGDVLNDDINELKRLFFNNYGNTISVQDMYGQASFSKYATDQKNNPDATPNQLLFASDTQSTAVNLIDDGSFETNTVWYTISGSDDNGRVSDSYLGDKALQVTANAGQTGAVRVVTSQTVAPGESYTISAYVKVAAAGDSAGVAFCAGSVYSSSQAQTSYSSNTAWERVMLTYTNTTDDQVTVSAYLVVVSTSTAVFDGVQFEKSTVSRGYNLVQNSDFTKTSNGTVSDWYKLSSGTSNTQVVINENVHNLDNKVVKLTGNPTGYVGLAQDVQMSGNAGDTFVFSGWAKGYSVPLDSAHSTARQFGIRITINYPEEGEYDIITACFAPHTNEWQYAAAQAVAAYSYDRITVEVIYDYNANEVCFDGIQLIQKGLGTAYTYNQNGDLIKAVDSRGRVSTYRYNSSTRDLTYVSRHDGSTSYTYNTYHNPTYVCDISGSVTTDTNYSYDSYGNVTWEYATSMDSNADDPTLAETSYTYTTNGNYLTSITDITGETTVYDYNPQLGTLNYVQYPGDGDDNVAEDRIQYTYDSLQRVQGVTQTSSSGNMTAAYTYDGDLLEKIQTASTTYTFTYGDFDLPQSVKAGNNTLATYTYNDDQQLAKLVYGNGSTVEYTYDNTGRVLSEKHKNPNQSIESDVLYLYDIHGHLAGKVDKGSQHEEIYTYDEYNRLVRYLEAGNNRTHYVRYKYDDLDRLIHVSESAGSDTLVTNYTYDSSNRLTRVDAEASDQAYAYNSLSQLVNAYTYHNNTYFKNDTYTYREPGDAEATMSSTGQIANHSVGIVGQGTVFNYVYSYDGNGNITSIRYTTGGNTYTTSYVYDPANQLIRENNQQAGKTWTWTYDTAGNITSRKEYAYTTGTLGTPADTVNYSYSTTAWGDLLTAYDGTAISYDAIGNMTNFGSDTFTWTRGRRLATMTKSNATWSFRYGANGMRTQRTNNTTTYNYTYNGDRLTYLTIGGNTLYFNYGINGTPLSVIYNGTYYYFITNIQGDIVAITDSSGNIVVNYTYDAWGNILSTTGSMAGSLGYYNPLRYRGYVYDTETGLYYLQSRYYNPSWGRFISPEPNAYMGGFDIGAGLVGYNLFAYCTNNPVMQKDPSGEFAITTLVVAMIGGAIAGALISTVSYVVSCGIDNKEVTALGLLQSAGVGFVTGGIGAAAGVIGGSVIIIGSVANGVISGGIAALNAEGPIEQKIATGLVTGVIAGFGTFLGTKMPIPTDNNLVAGVSAFVGGLFIGTQAEIVNVIGQQVISGAFENATYTPMKQANSSPLFS